MDSFQETFNDLENELISDFRRKRLNFYKEENARFEECLTRVGLMHDHSPTWDLDSVESVNALKELSSAQQYFETSECSAEAMALSYIEQKIEDNYCIKTLKSDINIYVGLNEELEKDIKTLTRQLDEAKKNMNEAFNVSKDIHIMNKKNEGYAKDLEKFKKKYPWLENPQLELTHIAKETQTLLSMLEEKEALEKEFSVYEGLSPDKQEALRQRNEMKKKKQILDALRKR
ncbi:uncharacterized protein LOC123672307 [Harmonia axyridis]|uniref:uncharacterized protein LOC123672307 n=1 Tax=Harmonia axyridis TaxID=115357 RepID=UPI001E2753A3|nr:uncharacterized protein LOC123672307 [Harmonia axyridis]